MLSGSGELTLSGTNTYTGGTTVTGGILTATSTGALPGFASGGVSVASGGGVAVPMSGWAPSDIDSLRNAASIPAGAYLGLDTTNGDTTYATLISGIGSNARADWR